MVGTVVKLGSRGSDTTATANESITEEHLASGLVLPLPGVLSEYRCFPTYGLIKVPSYLSDEEGSILPIAAVIAWMALNWMRPIGQPVRGADQVVLLQGTGGVSIAGLQLAKASGLTAIVTSSSDEKLNRAKELRGDPVINDKVTSEWQDEVMEITKGKGVDIIFEQGGPQTLAKSNCMRQMRRYNFSVGCLSGKQDDADSRINTNVLALHRNVTLKGIWNGPKDRLEEAVELYQQKKIHPVVDKVFTSDQAKEALQYIATGSHCGKVVLKVV